MKSNKSQPKPSDNVGKSRCKRLSTQTEENAKESQSNSSDVRKSCCKKMSTQIGENVRKGRKVQKKMLKTTRNREIFTAVLPGIRYCNGHWTRKKAMEVMDVSVMKSASGDLES